MSRPSDTRKAAASVRRLGGFGSSGFTVAWFFDCEGVSVATSRFRRPAKNEEVHLRDYAYGREAEKCPWRYLDYNRRPIDWYNHNHSHRNLDRLKPVAVHNWAARGILDKHRVVLEEAYASYALHQE